MSVWRRDVNTGKRRDFSQRDYLCHIDIRVNHYNHPTHSLHGQVKKNGLDSEKKIITKTIAFENLF